MAELTARCPKCNEWIRTGVGAVPPTVVENVLKGNIIRCPHCQTEFRWRAKDTVSEE